MQCDLKKIPILFVVMFLTVQTAAENYLGFGGPIEEANVNENQLKSDVEDVDVPDDYTTGLDSQKRRKNREWINVTMSQETYVLSRGQSYQLKCEAIGSPAPEIYWVRGVDIHGQINNLERRNQAFYSLDNNDQDVSKVVSKYMIHCASGLDAGPIYCVAISGGLVQTQMSIIHIDKTDRPTLREETCSTAHRPIIKKFRPVLLSVQGTTIVLPCDVSGNPKPQIFWQTLGDKGDTIDLSIYVKNNPRFEFLANGALLIKSLEWDDIGGYTCVANSTLGEDRAETFVYPMKPSNS